MPAQLARAGITGPRRFLAGDRGLYRTFIRKVVGDEARSDFLPGEPLQLRQLSFKAYCCCAATHAYIETMASIRDKVSEIESMDANVQTMTDSIVGTRNAHIYQPRNIEELQYSLPAQMALSALGKGNGYKTHRAFLEGKLRLTPDSDAIDLTKRIKLHVSPELDRNYPRHFVADVTVHYKDGSSEHLFQERAKGSPTKPFTREEHQEKLDELTDEVIGKAEADRLFALIDELAPSRPLGEITSLLYRQS